MINISIIISLILLIANLALAGAWLKKKGESELNITLEDKALFSYYKNASDNHTYLAKAFSFEVYNLYYQYGLTDIINLIVEEKWFNYKGYAEANNNSSFSQEYGLMLDDHYKKFENNPYETKLFLQTSIWSDDYSIISIQPGINSYNNGLDNAAELNFLYGYSFQIAKKNSYLNIETGIEKHLDSSNNINSVKTKFDITFGIDLKKKHTLLLKSFNSNNDGILRDQRVNSIEVSWVYKYKPNFFWKTGYSSNVTRRSEYITESIITGMTIKF